jgi:hypothetical protein
MELTKEKIDKIAQVNPELAKEIEQRKKLLQSEKIVNK